MIDKNKVLWLMAIFSCILFSCNKNNDKSSDNPPCPSVSVKIYGDTTLAAGDTLNLYATLLNGAVYSWKGPGGFTSSDSAIVIPEVTSLQAGPYIVTASIEGICMTTPDTFIVTVDCIPPDGVWANYYSPVATGGTLQLYAASKTDSVQYIWTGPGGFTSNLQNPIIPALTNAGQGTYVVYAYQDYCYSPADSISVAVAVCNPASNTFATSQGNNYFFDSFGTTTIVTGTRTLGATDNGTHSIRVTFPGAVPAAGVYTVNAAHCPAPPINGTLLSSECCVEYIDTTGTFLGVSGTVSLTAQNAMHFCSVPFKLQFTTTTLFTAASSLDY